MKKHINDLPQCIKLILGARSILFDLFVKKWYNNFLDRYFFAGILKVNKAQKSKITFTEIKRAFSVIFTACTDEK